MKKFLILCVDDEREVLDSVVSDLQDLESHFIIEAAESVEEAQEVVADSLADHIPLALVICDHIMPDTTGIEFLIELEKSPKTINTRKLLLTGQAGLEDTVEAVNNNSLDYFIMKPWTAEKLHEVVIEQLTQYMIKNEKDLMPWIRVLDTEKIMAAMNNHRMDMSDI